MVKKYKGEDARLEPPAEGWGIIIFGDGFKAQIGPTTKIVKKDDEEVIRFYIYPHEAIRKKFNINKDELDRNGYVYRWYPKTMVKSLNTYDPARRVFFCMLDFNAQETDSTNWFKGHEQAQEIRRLNKIIRTLRAHNEKLREDNFIITTNAKKWVKDNVDVLNMLMPSVSKMLDKEEKE